jgi:hypothetical protein
LPGLAARTAAEPGSPSALGERIVEIGFEPFSGGESGFQTRRSQRGENGAANRVVDLHRADAHTVLVHRRCFHW